MPRPSSGYGFLTATASLVVSLWGCTFVARAEQAPTEFDGCFAATVQPFLQQYCVSCHGKDKTEGDLDLSGYTSIERATRASDRWDDIIEKLDAAKMPPKKAKLHPTDDARRQVAAWFRAAREVEATHHAGDPGLVPARRLNNGEYDNSIRDLTGVDIRPAKEFPADPDNPAGFDNSGESLTMSPSLLQKYLQAAHAVADHLVLKPVGFDFAPRSMLVETDRDTYCVQRIIDFYHQQDTDYADYFEAAWRYKYRAALGKPDATLAVIAAESHLSPKYMATIWDALESQPEAVGPLVPLQGLWQELPAPSSDHPQPDRRAFEQMREYVTRVRRKVETRFANISAGRIGTASEPVLIWKNVQYATHRMTFDPRQLQVQGEAPPLGPEAPEPGAADEFGPGHTAFIHNQPGDPDLLVPAGQRAAYEAAFARFCRVFPDKFFMQERGRSYFDTTRDRARYLSAGFHNLLGYFRDDQPLYELILMSDQQKQLDELWEEMDFVADASRRTYVQFCESGQRGERSIKQTENDKQSPTDNTDVTSEEQIRELEQSYLSRARGGDPRGLDAITHYFDWMNGRIRWTDKARRDAEPSHVDAMVRFAQRAYRRPLSKEEADDVRRYYRACRKSGLDHESAIREGVVSILMSPDFCYRLDAASADTGIHPLSDYELASRLSYFLWSSMPDDELLAKAAAGDLHEPRVIVEQTRRMLKDSKMRALAANFGGSWLDFRHFDQITTVDRDRFPVFTNELRDAMNEEPIRFLTDAFQSNRSMLDLVYGEYTFVNPVLAKHYGMPLSATGADEWVLVKDAGRYGRGGLLPMAAFLTKNAPGQRTSPVKRGHWVVTKILGERISPPPPNVPQIPPDETKLELPLRDVLARHRQDPNCAACHARFDSFGLVFEGFGPVGEHRQKDLAGRPVDSSATFPDGATGEGLEGLRRYIRDHRQNDFVDNFTRKLLAYALGRTLIPSDDLLVRQINQKLAQDNYRVGTLIESIVTSPQFLNKRGHDQVAQR